MIEYDINNIKLIALYTGNKGYDSCACKCPCCSQIGVGGNYQGNIAQIDLILDRLKGLKQLYLFGNPDPVVDTKFCNEASRLAISRNVNVSYSTSGIGGIKTLKKLLDGIKPQYVDYISFSIDSICNEKISMLKGVNFPFEYAIDGIKWAIDNGYITKIQPTLWSCNYMETYDIIDFFAKLGIKKFSFHIGSIEKNCLSTHKHLNTTQMLNVFEQIENAVKNYKIQVSCPIIYPECGKNNEHKWYCMNPLECHNWLVFLKENGVFATHVPIMSEFNNKFCYDITKPIYIEPYEKKEFCPLSDCTSKQKTLCRYISKEWDTR